MRTQHPHGLAPRVAAGVRLGCALLVASLLGLAAQARAATITDFRPACGAPGDELLIRGSFDLGAGPPSVVVAGEPAQLLGARADRLLVRTAPSTPQSTSAGDARIEVTDALGSAAASGYTVLAPGAPLIYHLSATSAVPGQLVLAFGRRLGAGTAIELTDSTGQRFTVSQVRARHRRFVAFVVPGGPALGPATLLFTNAAGVQSGLCSPQITIAAAGQPTITAIVPADRLPGEPVAIEGTDLGPFGAVRVEWVDPSGGPALVVPGWSNGYDRVRSLVPPAAAGPVRYEVTVHTRAGASNRFAYTTGDPSAAPAPQITALVPDTGPALSPLQIRGQHLLARFARTELLWDGARHAILGFFVERSSGEHRLLSFVPRTASPGPHDVQVQLVRPSGVLASNIATFQVSAPGPLRVTALVPDTARREPLVEIHGSGFGAPGLFPLAVSFDDGTGPRRAQLLRRTENRLLVWRPEGRRLAPGTYTVAVSRQRSPSGPLETATAPGPYTVLP